MGAVKPVEFDAGGEEFEDAFDKPNAVVEFDQAKGGKSHSISLHQLKMQRLDAYPKTTRDFAASLTTSLTGADVTVALGNREQQIPLLATRYNKSEEFMHNVLDILEIFRYGYTRSQR